MISAFILDHLKELLIIFLAGNLVVVMLIVISGLPWLAETGFDRFFRKLDEAVTALIPILAIILWIMILFVGYYWSYLI
ncbi:MULTISPECIES: hypothetical protein [Lactobacillus]|uniref:Uncharacterized protein n=1 Tax=Lactobacillus xujianguonis TaxID=2495899 RepID=A0A437SWE7_9LACO|nr:MULTISPECIES: hypothetical protein [Lactobacillus]RVU71212.1 hypothetical protein EJK17_03165 [Lactobacillus xujianguonis]